MKTMDATINPPSGFLSSPDDEWSTRRLQLSIAGLISVSEAERDERGRFKRRFESTARERQPSIPLLAEWWEAI